MKLVVGCGYLGVRIARLWLAAGDSVVGIIRCREKAEALQRQGIRPIVADVTRPDTLGDLPAAESVLYAVGYDRQGKSSRRELYADGLRNVLDAVSRETRRIIFVSSTGVYGQTHGDWVDEDTPCRPTREGGQAMLAAEQVLREHPLGSRAVVLRLAGLYGPGRVRRVDDLRARRPIPVPACGHANLIHVADAAAVVVAAENRAKPPRTYVVSDGHPIGRRAFYECLAELLRLPRPQFVEPPPDDSAASRTALAAGADLAPSAGYGTRPAPAAADKRVRNARMLAELEVALKYPSYREGLAAIVTGTDRFT